MPHNHVRYLMNVIIRLNRLDGIDFGINASALQQTLVDSSGSLENHVCALSKMSYCLLIQLLKHNRKENTFWLFSSSPCH